MNKENINSANLNTSNKAKMMKIRKQNSQCLKLAREQSQQRIQRMRQQHEQQMQRIKHYYQDMLKEKEDYIQMLESLAYRENKDKKQQQLKKSKINISSLHNQNIVLHQTLDFKNLNKTLYCDIIKRQKNIFMNTAKLDSNLSKINTRRSKSKHCIQPVPKIDYRKLL